MSVINAVCKNWPPVKLILKANREQHSNNKTNCKLLPTVPAVRELALLDMQPAAQTVGGLEYQWSAGATNTWALDRG